MAHLLNAENLHVEFPTRVVFDSVSLGIDDGDRIGVVGRNGDGKSTLMKLLSGQLEPNSGKVTTRRGLEMGVLTQADTLDPNITVKQAIVGDQEDYEWARNSRIRDVIDGLVSDLPWEGTIASLSGGQRRRVSLAALLVGDHDVLFLDEPTNHLDVEGITWLANHIKGRWTPNDGAFMVVTHDRWFLDEVCTTTWEVHDNIVDPFEGGYAAYILQRVERDRIASVREDKRQNLAKKELAWLRRGPPARTSKPKFRIESANALIADVPEIRDKVALHQMATSRLGKEVVELEDVSVSYGDKQVLKNITWSIAPGERAGILGVNGAGKSTLLNVVTGAVAPTGGSVKRGKTVKLATLTQQSHELDAMADERVREILKRKRQSYVVDGREVSASQLLERLGFSSQHLNSYVKELSGGQKRRLQLLLILLDEPNVLIMDEPSNDLDTEMLAAMEDLLDTWPGTLLVVSHDRYLMERVTDNQYAVINNKLQHLPGGVEQYLEIRAAQTGTASQARSGNSSGGTSASQVSNAERQELKKELGSIERKLSKLPAQIAQAEAKIVKHDPNDYAGMASLAEILNQLKDKGATLETRWLEITDQLE